MVVRTIRSSDVPGDSEISKHLAGAHLSDAFAVSTNGGERSALALYIDIAAQTPGWINCLMAVRNRAVALFGLKRLGHLGDVDANRKPGAYRVGDRVGIFSILFLSEREVILLESDKHLEAKVSLCKTMDARGNSVAVMSTVIRIHNLLGHAYMLLVWPVHKLMVPSQLARSTRPRRKA